MAVLAIFSQYFWNFWAYMDWWDPTFGDSCLGFEKWPADSQGMRGRLEFWDEKMANQVFRHPYSLFFQIWWIFFYVWPQKFRIGFKNVLEVTRFVCTYISVLLDCCIIQECINNWLRSHKRPPFLLLTLGKNFIFLRCVTGLMSKWPG